jgi:CheY-like chemotaxis protein
MQSNDESGSRQRPLRVLVVEDEAMVRMMLEDLLGDLGYEIAGAAANLDEARQLAASQAFDIAVLDVNLNGEAIAPVADIVAQRGIPMVFATGYGQRGVPEAHRHWPTLDKPYQESDLIARIATALQKGP